MIKKFFVLVLALLLAFPACAVNEEPDAQGLRLPVVMYHHISPDSARWNDYVVSVDEFRGDMERLKAGGWHSISVRELLDWYDGNFEMPEKPFMITFDDGFESTAIYAEPILKELGFCGVAAIIGSVCEKFTDSEDGGHEWSHLSWQEAAEMSRRGVIEVQCHTWDMHTLASRRGCGKMSSEGENCYRYRFSSDVSRFLKRCRDFGVELAPSIAYPFGIYNPATNKAAEDMDFRVAFTCDEKINVLTGEPGAMYLLGRYNRPHGARGQKIFSIWEENC